MKITKELIDQWWVEWHSEGRIQPVLEHIAQRAAAWALEEAAKVCERETVLGNVQYVLNKRADLIRALKE